MNRFEIQRALDAIVEASVDWYFVAQAWICEPLRTELLEAVVSPDGAPIDPAYVAFLAQTNGLSVRTYDRSRIGAAHLPVHDFEVVDSQQIAPATKKFRDYADSMLDGAGTSLRSYPHLRDRQVLNESVLVVKSASPTLLWSSGQAESGVYIVDFEYTLEPNFLKKVASSFDEHLERSLHAMLENEGLSTYW